LLDDYKRNPVFCKINPAASSFVRSCKNLKTHEKKTLNPRVTMKGKTATAIVLLLEIASIAILHTVKIIHTERNTVKEASRSVPGEAMDSRQKSTFSMTAFK
jgi:hypothetical protein